MTLNRTMAALALALAGATAVAAEPASCQKVQLGDVGWTDVAATTGVASLLLDGLGYTPSKMIASVPILFTGLSTGQVDVFLGYWTPTMTPIAQPFIDKQQIDVLAHPNLEGAKYTLAVPDYAYQAGLRTFQDIARFADRLDHKIYGIEPGNDGNLLIQKMIDENQYGLGDFELIESSEAGMLVTLRRAVPQSQWMVFLGWEPHPMNFNQKIDYLDGGDEVFGPDYGAAKVYTAVSRGYADQCPNVGRLVGQLVFSTDMENQLMVPIMDGVEPEDAARDWLRRNPQVLSAWLEGVTTWDGQAGLAAVRAHLQLE
ncbi:choline ABC transporter substrate-binding protein [Castellaniella hirudinis]|uniref:choline ABC transporter substrate-binding protein n=1 Tax=Castellaniella hirudinis TaxID=1144617 RepID=UPI0039C1B65D